MAECSRNEWLDQPPDPDVERDLEYDLLEWEVIPARKAGGDQFIVLPKDEDALRRDAFIVTDENSLCELADHR